MDSEGHSLALVEDVLWVVTKPIGLGRYDFAFEQFFACRHPFRLERAICAIARMGAIDDYGARREDPAIVDR